MDCKGAEKVVQFDFVNTTSNPISIDLFNTNTITPLPVGETFSVDPFDLASTLNIPSIKDIAINTSNGDILYITSLTNEFGVIRDNVIIFQSVFAGALNTPDRIIYCPVNNNAYILQNALNNVRPVDLNTNTLGALIPVINPLFGVYNSTKNSIYITCVASTNLFEIDCNTNAIALANNLPFNGGALEFISSTNELYIGDNAFGILMKFDCAVNNNAGNIGTSGIPTDITFCPSTTGGDGIAYVINQAVDEIQRVDCGALFFSILDTTNTGAGSSPSFGAYDSSLDLFYLSFSNGAFGIEARNPVTNLVEQNFNTAPTDQNFVIEFNPVDNLVAVTKVNVPQGLLQYAPQGVSSTTFFVSGAVDYNFFTNNLESDPIIIETLQVISSNQNQLNNNLALKHKDADGHENSNPNFPILDVSIWQQQGNRAEVPLGGVILDGRTFFSQYILNPFQTVIFKIKYRQFNRFCFTTFPNLFAGNKKLAQESKQSIENSINEREYEFNGGNQTKFDIIKDCEQLEISVTNQTVNTTTFNFFEANQNSLIVNTPNATFGNVEDYNFLIQQLRDSPLVIDAVEIIGSNALGTNPDQLTVPLVINTSDSSGDSITYQRFPINYVASIQEADNRTIIKTNNLILDGYTTFALYNILPTSTITFVIYYKQFKRSLFLQQRYFTKFKEPLFNDGMSFAEEMEYVNEVSQESINSKPNLNTINNNYLNTEKNVNFETEQVYFSGFSGDKLTTPIFDTEETNQESKQQTEINQEVFNYRDVIDKNNNIKYKRKLF